MTVTIEPFRFPNGLVVSRLFREGSQVPLFAVREFDTKVLRVSAYKYTKKADGSDTNLKYKLNGSSEQAIRVQIRSAILRLGLNPIKAGKDEIKTLKEAGILGKRAPSCSLLAGKNMITLLKTFGEEGYSIQMRDMLGASAELDIYVPPEEQPQLSSGSKKKKEKDGKKDKKDKKTKKDKKAKTKKAKTKKDKKPKAAKARAKTSKAGKPKSKTKKMTKKERESAAAAAMETNTSTAATDTSSTKSEAPSLSRPSVSDRSVASASADEPSSSEVCSSSPPSTPTIDIMHIGSSACSGMDSSFGLNLNLSLNAMSSIGMVPPPTPLPLSKTVSASPLAASPSPSRKRLSHTSSALAASPLKSLTSATSSASSLYYNLFPSSFSTTPSVGHLPTTSSSSYSSFSATSPALSGVTAASASSPMSSAASVFGRVSSSPSALSLSLSSLPTLQASPLISSSSQPSPLSTTLTTTSLSSLVSLASPSASARPSVASDVDASLSALPLSPSSPSPSPSPSIPPPSTTPLSSSVTLPSLPPLLASPDEDEDSDSSTSPSISPFHAPSSGSTGQQPQHTISVPLFLPSSPSSMLLKKSNSLNLSMNMNMNMNTKNTVFPNCFSRALSCPINGNSSLPLPRHHDPIITVSIEAEGPVLSSVPSWAPALSRSSSSPAPSLSQSPTLGTDSDSDCSSDKTVDTGVGRSKGVKRKSLFDDISIDQSSFSFSNFTSHSQQMNTHTPSHSSLSPSTSSICSSPSSVQGETGAFPFAACNSNSNSSIQFQPLELDFSLAGRGTDTGMRGAMGEMDLSCNYSDLDLALNMQLTGDCEASDALALVSPVSSPLSQNTSKNDWLDMLDKQQAQAQGPFKGQAASSATSVAASASEFVFPPRKRAKFDTSSKSVKGDGGSHSQSHFLPADLLLGYNL